MGVSDGFVDFIRDQLSHIGPVSTRRMFSGAGLYADGVMFGLIIDDALYLKTDAESRRAFEDEGLEPFSYVRQGRRIATSFWRTPERCYEDAEEMHRWTSRAIAAARAKTTRTPRRAAAKKQRKAE